MQRYNFLYKKKKGSDIINFIILITALSLRITSGCVANVYQKKLTQNMCSPLFVNASTYIILSIFCIPLIFLHDFANLNNNVLFTAAEVGILGALGNGFLVKALQKGDLSILGPINAYKSVFGLIFAFFMLGEIPDIAGIIGIILIIFGSYFVLDTTEERFSFALIENKSIQYRFLALIFCSAEAVFIKKLISITSVRDAFVLWCFSGALFSTFLMFFNKTDLSKEFFKIKSRNILFILITVACIGIMQYTTNYVFNNMNVAYALALFQLSSIVSIFLGYKIFKEKNILKKLLGTVIMITGAVLIILFK